MTSHSLKFWKKCGLELMVLFTLALLSIPGQSSAQENQGAAAPQVTPTGQIVEDPADTPKPIVVADSAEPLEKRLARKITLDVRSMDIIDVIKFLALKGDFNVVTSASIQGRATFYLKSVSIKDALDIAVLSNRLAYIIQNDIIRILTEQEYEAVYGKSFSDRRQVQIIHLDYARPSYVLAALDGIKSAIGQLIIDEDTGTVVLIDTPESIADMKAAITKIEKPLESFVYPLQYAKADVVAEKLRGRIDQNAVGSITVDERSNRLIVRAFPSRRKEVENIIKSLDTKTKEVLIEARILQITFKPEYDVGVDWTLDFKNATEKEFRKLKFENILLGESNLAASDNLSSTFGKIAIGNIDEDMFELSVRALQQVNDTKILSNPKLLVTNNEEAQIHIGDTVPYIISTTSGTGDNAITSEDVRFIDVGLKLHVTPTINEDGYVTMRLKPEISTISGTIESQGGGIPQINKTEVETTVLVKDGATIILGGLNQDNKVHSKKGIPFLMDIPLLGGFFSRTSDAITTTETVILITPHIVSGAEHYTGLTGTIKPEKTYGDLTFKDEDAPIH